MPVCQFEQRFEYHEAKESGKKQRPTWSRLAFTPLAGHQDFNDLDVSVQAGFAAAEQTWSLDVSARCAATHPLSPDPRCLSSDLGSVP